MDVVVTKLLAVVEHLAYSHTFKSEAVANEVRQLLSEARAALDAPAAAPVEAPSSPADPTGVTPAPAAPVADSGSLAPADGSAVAGTETAPNAG